MTEFVVFMDKTIYAKRGLNSRISTIRFSVFAQSGIEARHQAEAKHPDRRISMFWPVWNKKA